jgi:hypothetical protein
MPLRDILEYFNFPLKEDHTLAEYFGCDNFAFFLYSTLRMQQPSVVVELGTGAATTSLMAAEALHHNRTGHIWTVDDGSQWRLGPLRQCCQHALEYVDEHESQSGFIKRLLQKYALDDYLTFIETHLDEEHFFSPEDRKIDVLFADAVSAGPIATAALLRYYLPKMGNYSSIFIDRTSTIHESMLLLNYFIDQLNRGRIPLDLLRDLTPEQGEYLRDFVDRSSFSIVHLTDTVNARALNAKQNSRTWVRIEPLDHFHYNDVINYVGRQPVHAIRLR